MPRLTTLDHLVLTVTDLDRTVAFYRDVLGMGVVAFGPDDRIALTFGAQKINLHAADAPVRPNATHATPGSADLCFLTDTPLSDWQTHLAQQGIPVEIGPVPRTGAGGPITSIYLRDPDGNLIELAVPDAGV
ncbi:VOC family protein [Loktanella sp. SALINAS62]|uniref:VOC family protein n=1 Tax=Loktanella sp. SALINAS62 TaxID=2706124 RepID=UPI001B8D225A|nr:VOC family protein [Loktanella sp. SALINAS62]MBS1300980.1 VOC family protein [Loktanella sp. SALINAS62]